MIVAMSGHCTVCLVWPLQVAVGLRSQGFVRKLEAWWGPAGLQQAQQTPVDGPLTAIRISFTGDKDPAVSVSRLTAIHV